MMNDLQTPLSSQSDASTDRIHVFWDDGMLSHDTGKGVFDTGMDPGFLDVLDHHPENSDRVRNLLSILKRGPISPFISWHSGRPALTSELLSFHTPGLASLLYSFSPLFSLGQEFVEPTNILIMNTHLNNLFDLFDLWKWNPPIFLVEGTIVQILNIYSLVIGIIQILICKSCGKLFQSIGCFGLTIL